MTHIHCAPHSIPCACLLLLSALACTPLRDLDAAAAGFDAAHGVGGAGSGNATVSQAGNGAGGAHISLGAGPSDGGASNSVSPSALGGRSNAGTAGRNGGAAGTPQNLEAGGAHAAEAGSTASAGAAAAQAGAAPVIFADLPNDLPDSPVSGDVSWLESNYSGQATFDVLTPTARYSVLKDGGSIISIIDQTSSDPVMTIQDGPPRSIAALGGLAG